jgi:hypothetical protein
MTRPRDQRGRFRSNWVVRGRVIRHVDPAIPEPETHLFVLADWLEAIWADVKHWIAHV